MPARQLFEVLADYRAAVERFDPLGKRRERLQQFLAEGGKPDLLKDDKELFYRLLQFERFLEREEERIALCPEQLRPIAAGEAFDSTVRPDVMLDLERQPPRRPWLELTHPFETAPDAARLRTLRGHTAWVWAASWDRAGTRIVSASDDETLIVWDAATGERQATLTGHTSWVRAASWDRAGKRIVSASDDKTLIVWDAATGERQATLTGHTDRVNAASWDRAGTRIVSASDDKTLIVWDAATGQPLVRYPLEATGLSVEWNPTGNKELVVGQQNGWVRIYRFHEAPTPSINDDW